MAADVAELHDGVLKLIREALPHITVYDGDVPRTPPADQAGRVYPYVVVWSTAPRRHPDHPLAMSAGDGLSWASYVTVAAGTQAWCLSAAQAVRAALDGAEPGTGAGALREPLGAPGDVVVRKDPDATPVRFYVPTVYQAITA